MPDRWSCVIYVDPLAEPKKLLHPFKHISGALCTWFLAVSNFLAISQWKGNTLQIQIIFTQQRVIIRSFIYASTNWFHLAVFSLRGGLARHFMAPQPPPTLHPYRSACGIGIASKGLSKMVGNSGSYSFNSWSIDRLWIALELWWIACKHSFSFLRYNTSNT